MRCVWRVERAVGAGHWFVGMHASRISVLAPPGVRLHRAEHRRELVHGVAGWRHATWAAQPGRRRPTIDRDRPQDVREITTRTALRLLPQTFHELVWGLLCAQLLSARALSAPAAGHLAAGETARAGTVTAHWLEGELRTAFPERIEQLERELAAALPLVRVPDTVEELLATCARRLHAREELARGHHGERSASLACSRQSLWRDAPHPAVGGEDPLGELPGGADALAAALDSVERP